jgi:hypothetical protein
MNCLGSFVLRNGSCPGKNRGVEGNRFRNSFVNLVYSSALK